MAQPLRYRHIGRVYDLISMERLLYATPRRRLLSLIGPLPAATVVDVGCGTGLNFAGLRHLVGPAGRIVGIDSSQSMLGAAERRIRSAGWSNVTTVHGDIDDVLPALRAAELPLADVDVLIATFVISTIDDDTAFWDAVHGLCQHCPPLIAIADLGEPNTIGHLRSVALRALAALGGSRPTCQPWNDLVARSDDAIVESHLGGHVRLAVGHCRQAPPGSSQEPAC